MHHQRLWPMGNTAMKANPQKNKKQQEPNSGKNNRPDCI
jgi:hypothetical protein